MTSEAGSSNVKKVSALIVDNDHKVRRNYSALLNRYGFKTYSAENGKEVVDLFHYGEYFDVVFMDVIMPITIADGIEATKMLREMGAECMIIAMTPADLHLSAQELYETGLDNYCQKPLTAEFVASICEKLMFDDN